MSTISWLFLIAAMLPFLAAVCAKAGGKGFTNHDPRPWLASLQGWRGRANAAQANTFEALPFFYAASLFALHRQVDPQELAGLMAAWLIARFLYLVVYISGHSTVRSIIWAIALGLNITIVFTGV